MIVIAVDVGTVRVGVAWGDTQTGFAFPAGIYQRAQGRAEKALKALIEEKEAGQVVIGLALGERGEPTELSENARAFARRLSKRVSVPIAFVDESFSSEDALERLTQAGAEKTELDAYAATIILERFFEGGELNIDS